MICAEDAGQSRVAKQKGSEKGRRGDREPKRGKGERKAEEKTNQKKGKGTEKAKKREEKANEPGKQRENFQKEEGKLLPSSAP